MPLLCALLAAAELTVFAASSLRDAFQELGRRFESAHAGATVSINFAGSQELRTQIEHGARADVLASADQRHVSALVDAGLLEPPRTFARNEPVIVVPRGNPAAIRALVDLPRAERIVVGVPDVPIGEYTLRILEGASARYGPGFRDAVEARIASRELNVRQVLAKVRLGEADAAIVYRTDALAAGDAVETISIPADLNVMAEYPIAPLRGAPQPALGRAFIDLVLSPAGRAVLARYGFR
jgi:molybdate transport system substrate-binding protein